MSKRLFDIIASAVGLLLLSVPMLVIWCAVVVDSGTPGFYLQTRIGLRGKPFRILKYRTMVQHADRSGSLSLGQDPRITRVGSVLRRYKLDELPQLVNVLVGQMSLVGPRPEVPEYAFLYPEQSKVWMVRPGITDPTSLDLYDESAILGQETDPQGYYVDVLLPEKTRRYLEYIDMRSFWGDIRLILMTIGRAMRRQSEQ